MAHHVQCHIGVGFQTRLPAGYVTNTGIRRSDDTVPVQSKNKMSKRSGITKLFLSETRKRYPYFKKKLKNRLSKFLLDFIGFSGENFLK
jgi:hypothetical protein